MRLTVRYWDLMAAYRDADADKRQTLRRRIARIDRVLGAWDEGEGRRGGRV